MIARTTLIIGLAIVLGFEVSTALRCHECNEQTIKSNPRVQHTCLTDDDNFGAANTCNDFNPACVKKTYTENGRTFNIRSCESAPNTKFGTCEDQTITLAAAGTKSVKACYCGEDFCNGTSSINSSFYILAFLAFAILLIQRI